MYSADIGDVVSIEPRRCFYKTGSIQQEQCYLNIEIAQYYCIEISSS